MHTPLRLITQIGIAIGLSVGSAAVSAPAPGGVHVRGAIQSFKGQAMTVTSASGPVRVLLTPKVPIASIVPSDRAYVKDGSFLGIASAPGPGGSQQALEVVVFPETARGTGEGSYDWDLPVSGGKGHSKMTNGTVRHAKATSGTKPHSTMTNGTVHRSTGGDSLTLQYKNGTGIGSQTITLPPGIPFVTFIPGQVSQLKPGAHVFIAGHRLPNGTVAADRVLVGKNGLVPPM